MSGPRWGLLAVLLVALEGVWAAVALMLGHTADWGGVTTLILPCLLARETDRSLTRADP